MGISAKSLARQESLGEYLVTDMPAITTDTLLGILDGLKAEYMPVFDAVDLDKPAPAMGEWTARQVLSHIIGSLQRTPVQIGYFLAEETMVPVVFSDPYWLDIWHDAPLPAFKAAFEATIEGNKALVRTLTPANLALVRPIFAFGELPLGVFLTVSYQRHVRDQHLHQLQAFTAEKVAVPALG